jgi:hypothetical protein
VHEVEEGQRDVEHVEGVGRHRNAGIELGRVFEDLDHQETAAAQEAEQDVARHGPGVVAVCGLHGAHDEPRTGDQQHRVQRAGVAVQRLLVELNISTLGPGKGIGREEDGEGQHLGKNEEPDRQVAGQALVLIQAKP